MAFISDLDPAIPTDDDLLDSLDVEITGIKQTLQDQFPNFNAVAVNATPAELNLLVGVPADLEHMGNKGSEKGYCPLNESSVVPLVNLPDTLTGKDADTVDGLHANVFAQLTGAMFTGGVTLTSDDFTVDMGNLVALAGVFQANHSGKAFESLENPLEASLPLTGAADYSVIAGQRGDSSVLAAANKPMVNFQQHIRPNAPTGTGTGFGFLFQGNRYGETGVGNGDQPAYYNLVGLTRSYSSWDGANGAHDVVAVAGIAKAQFGSTCRAYGLFGDAAVYNTSGKAVGCEIDVRNTTGVEAPDTHATNGSTIGLAIVGITDTATSPGSLYNTYALLFQANSISGWKRGITFDPTSIAPNGVAIDFTRLTGSGIMPILLKNNDGIYSNDVGGTPIEILQINASDNLVLRTRSEIRFSEENVPSTMGTWIGSNKHLIVGSTTDDGVNILQVHGPIATVGSFPLKVNSVQVVGTRRTGWSAATGTATRTTFATSTVTTAQLAERVKALIDDLITHGMIGA